MVAIFLMVALQVPIPTPLPTPTPVPVPTPVLGAPSPVVERIVEQGFRTVRLSLFDNYVAVVKAREGAQVILLRKLTLDGEEYSVYVDAVARDCAAAAVQGGSRSGPDGSQAVIRAWDRGGVMHKIYYSPTAVLDLATARLVATLDDLERRVSDTSPFYEEVRNWNPSRGDVVEMVGGQRARVAEVRTDGVIVVEFEDVSVFEVLAPQQRVLRIWRVVAGTP